MLTRIIRSIFAFGLTVLLSASIPAALAAEKVAPTPAADSGSSVELVKSMGLGWNLGNTMEACGDWIKGGQVLNYETAWGNPETTKEMIDAIQAAGFKSVRIPVAWSNLMEENNTISKNLLERVKQITDWVLADGMVAVVNIHWDSGWWAKFPTEYDKSMNRYIKMWWQIAKYYKDYPSTLVFESLNEEGCFGDVWNRYGGGTTEQRQKAYGILNNINQTFVDLVRKSGGQNAKRHLLIAGYCTDIDLTVDANFVMPKDPANHCIVSVHYYTPYTFAGLEKDESWGKVRTTWGTPADLTELDSNMQKLKVRFVDQGIPVILGEYGATTKNREPESFHLYVLSVAEKIYQLGMCPMLWDNGAHFNRRTLQFNDPDLLKGLQKIMKGGRSAGAEKKPSQK